MVMDFKFIMINGYTKDSIKIIKSKEKVLLNGEMAIFIRDNFSMTKY